MKRHHRDEEMDLDEWGEDKDLPRLSEALRKLDEDVQRFKADVRWPLGWCWGAVVFITDPLIDLGEFIISYYRKLMKARHS